MKCKAVRCIYYNAGNGYTVASYVTEETLPKEVSSQKNGRYGMFMAIGNELPTEDGLEVELNGTWKDGKFGILYFGKSMCRTCWQASGIRMHQSRKTRTKKKP